MEEYWNTDEPGREPEDQSVSEQNLFDEPDVVEEPPKPKKKKKKKSFKRKLKKMLRRFFKLPLLTRVIALAAVVIVIVVIVLLLVLLPKNCKSDAAASRNAKASASPEATVEATESPEVIPTATFSPVPTATSIPRVSGNLKSGDRADVVPFIRTRLVELGYMEMPATNDDLYDQATMNAVKRFQCRNFTDDFKAWDGLVGEKTYDRLFSNEAKSFYMKSGDTDKTMYDGDLVSKMQTQLVALGYLKKVTGTYDRDTVDAVRRFQKASSIDSDGVAGQATLRILATAYAAGTAAPETSADTTIVNTTPNP